MRVDSVTNNTYGAYGVGPVVTEIAKTKPEPKYNKYLRREPKIPFEGEKTETVVEEAPVEISDEEKTEEDVITEETKVEDLKEETDETTEDIQEDEKVKE